jgi:uncharacterized protein YcfJ
MCAVLLTCLLPIMSGAHAGEMAAEFEDTARVLSVEPIVESLAGPSPQVSCRDERLIEQDPANGDRYTARSLTAGIGADIRRRNTLLRPVPVCEPTGAVARVPRTLGYWVTYSYQGRTHVRRMDHHPGDRLTVNIRLQPVP